MTKSPRRTRKGKRTTMTKAAKTSWALSELPGVANEPEMKATSAAAESTDRGDRTVLTACMLGAAGCNFALQLGTMSGLFPGMGPVAAAGLVLAEMGCGYGIEICKDRGARGMLLAVLLLFGLIETGLPLIREVQVHQQAVTSAAHDVPPATEVCTSKDPPKEYGTQRLPIWQEGERRRMADCRAAQVSERREHQGALAAAASEHSIVETPIRMLLGLGLSLAIGGMARALRARR